MGCEPKTTEWRETLVEHCLLPDGKDCLSRACWIRYRRVLVLRSSHVPVFFSSMDDLVKLLKRQGLKVSLFIKGIHNEVKKSNKLLGLYDNYLKETKELYNSREEVEEILRNKEILRKYIALEVDAAEEQAVAV